LGRRRFDLSALRTVAARRTERHAGEGRGPVPSGPGPRRRLDSRFRGNDVVSRPERSAGWGGGASTYRRGGWPRHGRTERHPGEGRGPVFSGSGPRRRLDSRLRGNDVFSRPERPSGWGRRRFDGSARRTVAAREYRASPRRRPGSSLLRIRTAAQTESRSPRSASRAGLRIRLRGLRAVDGEAFPVSYRGGWREGLSPARLFVWTAATKFAIKRADRQKQWMSYRHLAAAWWSVRRGGRFACANLLKIGISP